MGGGETISATFGFAGGTWMCLLLLNGSSTCQGVCKGRSLLLMMSERYLPDSCASPCSQLPAWPAEATSCLGDRRANCEAYLSWKKSWSLACFSLPRDPGQVPSLLVVSVFPRVRWGGRTRGFLRCQHVFTPNNDDPCPASCYPALAGAVQGGAGGTRSLDGGSPFCGHTGWGRSCPEAWEAGSASQGTLNLCLKM